MASEEECHAFLADLTRIIESETLDFILRKENRRTLSNLGISIDDAKYTIRELTIDNYYKGPKKDHQYASQEIWEFGIDDFFIEEEYPFSSLYVKIVIRPSKNDMAMISFHPARFSIVYPFKKH